MSIRRDALIALREQLLSARGADRNVDYALAHWQGWTEHDDAADPVFAGVVSNWWAEPGREWSTCSIPPVYTGSVDDALCFAEQVDAKEWPFILDRARSSLARRHSWHTTFARPGQREELPREICLYTISALLASETPDV